ncbi:MAG: YggS family pyridoxal phosphate-dependent enzyme [Rhodospirillaceae bacterium]|nr:YggS family pyridoxal phosphate-dependent enzyme [Rhodospirillaceae bacterium]
MTDSNQAARNLATIKQTIDEAAGVAKGEAGPPTLVCVSKTHEAMEIIPVLGTGHRVFGENRVQEAMAKWPDLKKQFSGVELHLIGPLQTNKVSDAVKIFDVIETVDREKLARALSRVLAKETEKTKKNLPVFIQINTGEEEQKAGISPTQADAFISLCRDELKLNVVGLMCIPPVEDTPGMHFALLGKIAKRHNIKNLSMGMSADYETAIHFGATHVRIGTAIFGARK